MLGYALDTTTITGYIYYRSERSGRRNPSNALAAADSRPRFVARDSVTYSWNFFGDDYVNDHLSVTASIAIWFLAKEPDLAHGERFGIFVGLWAPTFFALSSRLHRFAYPSLQQH